MEIVQYLENFNLISIILRMTLATLFGGLIGLDRAAHGQSAGIRTFALVCLGSSMVMITNEYLFTVYGNGDRQDWQHRSSVALDSLGLEVS